MHSAAAAGNEDVLQALVAAGADVHHKNQVLALFLSILWSLFDDHIYTAVCGCIVILMLCGECIIMPFASHANLYVNLFLQLSA